MKLVFLIIINFFSQAAFAQHDFGILSCNVTQMVMLYEDGSTRNMPIPPNAKPFSVEQRGDRLFSSYPDGTNTSFHGAIFSRASTETFEGAPFHIRRFERQTSNSSAVVGIGKKVGASGYILFDRYKLQDYTNVLISMASCK